MKKQKIAVLALAGALLVGGTFAGTKALFTDKVDHIGTLSISTGTLDIEVVGNNEWKLTRNGDEVDRILPPGAEGFADFGNLKYGDVLTKKVEVCNMGTLKALVTLEENTKVTENLPKGIEYKVKLNGEEINNSKDFELGVTKDNKRAEIDFVIAVTGGGEHNANGSLNSNEQASKIIDLNDSYTLTAKQQNPNNK